MKCFINKFSRVFFLCFLIMFSSAVPAAAGISNDTPPNPPRNEVMFELAAEDWVTTKTARVVLMVEAAITSDTAGSAKSSMLRAVNDVAKAEWRLIGFNRSLDSTGLERWNASFETRLAESDLSGLAERAKKQSKAGMQVRVDNIDFSPTLDEVNATTSQLRGRIYKMANEQLAQLSGAISGNQWKIASITFTEGTPQPIPMLYARQKSSGGNAPMMLQAASSLENQGGTELERAEKIVVRAYVVLASPEKQ